MKFAQLAQAKQQYLEQQVNSASPEQLLTMLYDRLLLDIERAGAAQDNADWATASAQLTHAQQIVGELNSSLSNTWQGAEDLRALYVYLNGQLIAANVTRDRNITTACRDLVAPLRDAWHQAAATLVTSAIA